jgi:hypothetical protein
MLSIPTYWCGPEGRRAGEPVYDHPTCLGQEGTLARCLESIPDFEGLHVNLVLATTSADIDAFARAKVGRILKESLPAGVEASIFGRPELSRLEGKLRDRNLGHLIPLIGIEGYGHVRNASIFAALLLNMDALLLIDDDEVLVDGPEFLTRIHDHLAQGKQALAGYYLNKDSGYLLPDADQAWDEAWGKREAMNQGFRQVIGAERITKTPFVFGGNMCMTKKVMTQVLFDPWITRGEDIDYLITAKSKGIDFLLDPALPVLHLPPSHSSSRWKQVEQDVIRFIYQRDKLVALGVTPDALDPYPGLFLRDDMEQRLGKAVELLAEAYEEAGEEEKARAARALVTMAASRSQVPDISSFLKALDLWPSLTSAIQGLGLS